MSDEKMTLDDLLSTYDRQQLIYSTTPNLFKQGIAEGYRDILNYIRAHRAELEVGMRGTLRFATPELEWDGEPGFPCRLLDKNGEYTGVQFLDRAASRQFAKSLGLTAEFVEEKDENNY